MSDKVRQQAEAVLAMPEADRIFGRDTLAEVAVSIEDRQGWPRMVGRVDRLWIGPDHVEIIDIKSDAVPPMNPEGVPRAYLAQLGAYQDGIASDWPGKEIRLFLLWTAIPAIMQVPSEAAEMVFKDVRRDH